MLYIAYFLLPPLFPSDYLFSILAKDESQRRKKLISSGTYSYLFLWEIWFIFSGKRVYIFSLTIGSIYLRSAPPFSALLFSAISLCPDVAKD